MTSLRTRASPFPMQTSVGPENLASLRPKVRRQTVANLARKDGAYIGGRLNKRR